MKWIADIKIYMIMKLYAISTNGPADTGHQSLCEIRLSQNFSN
jgi:hypothetical protein